VPFTIRLATPADVQALQSLITASVRGLQTRDYTAVEIEGALASVFGVDTQLIADGHVLRGRIQRGPDNRRLRRLEQTPDAVRCRPLDAPRGRAARPGQRRRENPARSSYTRTGPRRGVGTAILDACEDAAIAAGFTRLEMGATLTGVPFYAARGYRASDRFNVPLTNGETLADRSHEEDAARRVTAGGLAATCQPPRSSMAKSRLGVCIVREESATVVCSSHGSPHSTRTRPPRGRPDPGPYLASRILDQSRLTE